MLTSIPMSVRNNINVSQSQQSSQNNLNYIRVNQNNQELNNIINAIGLETKKVLPRGKKDGTFDMFEGFEEESSDLDESVVEA